MGTLAEQLRVSTPERSTPGRPLRLAAATGVFLLPRTYPATRRTRPAWARAAQTVADRLRRAGLGTSSEIVVGRHTGARC
jgi:hypothetical protein